MDQKYRKPINKLKIFNLFQDTRNEPKYAEWIEKSRKPVNKLKLFYYNCLKTGSGP